VQNLVCFFPFKIDPPPPKKIPQSEPPERPALNPRSSSCVLRGVAPLCDAAANSVTPRPFFFCACDAAAKCDAAADFACDAAANFKCDAAAIFFFAV